MKKTTQLLLLLFFSTLSFSQCTTPLSIPFLENFQGGTVFPSCFVTENADGINPIWTVMSSNDFNQDGTNDHMATVFATSVSQPDKNDWLFSPLLSFTAGMNYTINVRFNSYDIGNVTANQSFSLYLVNTASSTASTQISLGNFNNITQNGVLQANNGTDLMTQAYNTGSPFTPSTSENYRIAIHANKSGNAAPLFIFSVEVVPQVASTEDFNTNSISYFYNSTTDTLDLNSSTSQIESIELYNIVGQKVKTQMIEQSNFSLNLSTLDKGVYLVKAFINKEIKSFKFIKN